MARHRRAHGAAHGRPRQPRHADARHDGRRAGADRGGDARSGRLPAQARAESARSAALSRGLPAGGRGFPPRLRSVPCAAGSAASHRGRVACSGGAHAAEHGMDEPGGRQPAATRRTAAAHRRDQRVSRKARPQVTRRKVGLRTRLFYLAAAAFLPLALMSGIGLLALVQQQRQQAERAGVEITRALSTAVDAELSRSLAVLEAMATSTVLDRIQLARLDELAKRIAATRPQWRAVILHDARGKMIFNSAYTLDAPLPQTAEGESLERVLRERSAAIGGLARGPRGSYSFALRVPVVP